MVRIVLLTGAKMKYSFIFLSIILPFFAYADDSPATKWNQTKEAICFNHPNKQLCLEGIKALMKGVKAATDVHYACLKLKELDSQKNETCDNVEESLSTLEQ